MAVSRVLIIPLDSAMDRVSFAASGTVFAVLDAPATLWVTFASGGDLIDLQTRGDKLVSCTPRDQIFVTLLSADVVAGGRFRLLVSDELNMSVGP